MISNCMICGNTLPEHKPHCMFKEHEGKEKPTTVDQSGSVENYNFTALEDILSNDGDLVKKYDGLWYLFDDEGESIANGNSIADILKEL